MAATAKRWTPIEDAFVLEVHPKVAAAKLGRSYHAVKQRRFNLRHPRTNGAPRVRWTPAEIKILRDEYPIAQKAVDLVPMLQRFTIEQIKSKARYCKIKRIFLGDVNAKVEGHGELVDQIRIRAKQDGIPFYRLDEILDTGTYFKYNSKRQKANLRAVARAVEFFGGTLVIDWRDR